MARDTSRDRSRSPGPRKPRTDRGFRWKQPKPKTDDAAPDYRERREERYEDSERPRKRRELSSRDDVDAPRKKRDPLDADAPRKKREPPADDLPRKERTDDSPALDDDRATDQAAAPAPSTVNGVDVAAKFGAAAAARVKANPPKNSVADLTRSSSDAAAISTSASTPRAPTGPMILVTVNDRLGTKAQVPCLPSDTIGDFKKMVAMRIGRRPHEILVKRQSERPFKDKLTLEDYGVGNGVQLDLELDTGE